MIGGTDISLEELGLGDIAGEGPNNLKIVGFSANRGIDNEILLVRTEFPDTDIYIVVIGANGAYSAAPYTLQIETSRTVDLTELLEGTIVGEPLVVPPTTGVDEIHSVASPTTLFVTQRERMIEVYDMNEAIYDWAAFELDLISLANHDAVAGKIISLPSIIYDDWDERPYDVNVANVVTNDIREIIQDIIQDPQDPLYSPDIEYVVFLGNDTIVPYRRVPDETIISNERLYIMGSFLKPTSPLFASLLEGNNLTDDYYVDFTAIPWQGRSLYIPDLSVARLVETPREIGLTATTFVANDGELSPTSALVTGYDFFQDGAWEIEDTLDDLFPTTTLINNDWDAEDLYRELLEELPTPDMSAINAHFTHYAALSAYGFQWEINDFLSTIDVALAVDNPPGGDPVPVLKDGLIFSMGCHAGFNAPDEAMAEAEPGLGIDPRLDFPQVMAQQQAVFWGSNGYGLGDDAGIGGTEQLIVLLAEELLASDSIGQATTIAKQDYLSGLSTMTVYDEKSSIQFTLYGLPQYSITPGTQTAISDFIQAMEQTNNVPTPYTLNLTINEEGEATINETYDYFIEGPTPDGSYFTANGDAQATAHRPVQPRVVRNRLNSEARLHGILLTDGRYVFPDFEDFDPVITRPTTDNELYTEELQIRVPAFWPAELATLNSLQIGQELNQTAVFIPGQFRATNDIGTDVSGLQRIYTELTFEYLQEQTGYENDWEAPEINGIDLSLKNPSTLSLIIDTEDENGIAQIAVVVFHEGFVDLVPPTILPP
jgi:hypothetical protein